MMMVAVLDEENLTFLCHTSTVVLGVINQEALASNDFWVKNLKPWAALFVILTTFQCH